MVLSRNRKVTTGNKTMKKKWEDMTTPATSQLPLEGVNGNGHRSNMGDRRRVLIDSCWMIVRVNGVNQGAIVHLIFVG